MNRIVLGKDEKEILDILNRYGKGYVVGGYIRDLLLGLQPKDCDFATDIEYEELKRIFEKYNPLEIGKSFGIIQIKYNNKKYEIAKLRREMEFSERRNKIKMEFVNSIEEDLKRRDFTINAIAFDGERLIFTSEKAKDDLRNRVLNFVGEGKNRIKEDSLRVLRGIRIAGLKGLTISERCKDEMREGRFELKKLSSERVQEEILKMLESNSLEKTLGVAYELGVLEILFPETVKNNNIPSLISKLNAISIESKDYQILRLALFFMSSKEEISRLKLSNQESKRVIKIVENYDKITENISDYMLKKYLFSFGKDVVYDIIRIKKSLKKCENLEVKLNQIFKREEPILFCDLNIDGEFIKESFALKGKEIGEALKRCLDYVWRYPNCNNREALVKFLKKEREDE